MSAGGPEIWFYHLERPGHDARLSELLERALARGWSSLVLSPEPERLRALDQSLWTAKPESFLPHALAGASGDASQPILLAGSAEPPATDDRARALLVLVHGAAAPADIGGFERVIVLFEQSEAPALAAARMLYKTAKAGGAVTRYFREDSAGKWAEQIAH